jgi:hypothetical protein
MSSISPPSTSSTLTDLKQYAKEEVDAKPIIQDKVKVEEELQRKVDETVQRIRDTSEQWVDLSSVANADYKPSPYPMLRKQGILPRSDLCFL